MSCNKCRGSVFFDNGANYLDDCLCTREMQTETTKEQLSIATDFSCMALAQMIEHWPDVVMVPTIGGSWALVCGESIIAENMDANGAKAFVQMFEYCRLSLLFKKPDLQNEDRFISISKLKILAHELKRSTGKANSFNSNTYVTVDDGIYNTALTDLYEAADKGRK